MIGYNTCFFLSHPLSFSLISLYDPSIMLKYLLIILLFLCTSPLIGQNFNQFIRDGLPEGVTIDLREPLYIDGVLTTEKGGVITGPNLRVQALRIRYTRKIENNELLATIEAEGQLGVEFGEYAFVGDKLFYDFNKQEGILYKGRTSLEPWFFGGEKILLRPNGDYLIYNGYVTTSENEKPDWDIYAAEIEIKHKEFLHAQDIQLHIYHFPLLWIPSLKTNLSSIFDSPIRYRFRWGGRQGPRFGFTYELFSWQQWKAFLRFDYRLTRGPGGGFELYYESLDGKTAFESVNYVAKDSSLFDLNEKARYRFEGMYRKSMMNDKVNILFTYEKVSDIDLPNSYYDKDFDLGPAKRTQLLIRQQEENWMGEFYSRVRVNNYQTVKQELPTLSFNLRPFVMGPTGIISENWARVSYLDFNYSNHLIHVHNYHSTRLEYRPKLYRPFSAGPFTLTPELGVVAIFYGNSPTEDSKWLGLGLAAFDIQTQLFRHYGQYKHVIEPYLSYHYYTYPTVPPSQHFIFDIDDGWYRLNQLTVGCKNSLYSKQSHAYPSRLFSAHLYAHAFFDVHTFRTTIPRIYSQFTFFSLPTLRHYIETAWDFEHQELDHFNIRSEWTLNADFAIAAELRHRDAFSWRKVDRDNFFLEMFHSEKLLRHSPLSDRRDTLLLHLFYRFHPNWACELSSRQGWNRLTEPDYTEYEIDILTTIQTAWHVRLSFQHTENDNRVALYVNVGLKRPERQENDPKIYCYE